MSLSKTQLPHDTQKGWSAHIPAFLIFLTLAAIMVGRSLVEGGGQICAADAPDTWIHMWAFWRAKYAVFGHDHSYLLSHTLSYPGIVREPIAIFDPLLPLLSIPIQLIFNSCSVAFNWLVFFGLVFTGMAGYILGIEFGARRTTAILVGVIIAANPFTYRLLSGGYTEYAWWGLLPLTIALYHRCLRTPSRGTVVQYIGALTTMLLMSIYCSFYFVLFASASLLLNILHTLRRSSTVRLKRLLKVQSLTLLCLMPLLLLWLHALSLLGWKNVGWPHPFPVETVSHFSDQHLPTSNNADALSFDLAKKTSDDRTHETETKDWMAWRTLMGSLDLAELLSVKRSWNQKYPPSVRQIPNGTCISEAQAIVYLDESVFAPEWYFVGILVALALLTKRRRRESTGYALLALAFFTLALGPLPLWNGHIASFTTLPYAWMYHWVPGFSRFFIPARAFLGTVICLAVLAARGTETLSDIIARHARHTPHAVIDSVIVILVLTGFAAFGYQGLTLPQINTQYPSLYDTIHDEVGTFALLDLPTGDPSLRRMYYQSVHGHPIYGGQFAEEWTDENGAEEIKSNPLVLAMEHPPSASRDIEELHIAVDTLSHHGFRYLILHQTGYDRDVNYTAAIDLATAILHAPVFADGEITAYRLPPTRIQPE